MAYKIFINKNVFLDFYLEHKEHIPFVGQKTVGAIKAEPEEGVLVHQ